MRDILPVTPSDAPSEPVFILSRSMTRWTANQSKALGFFRQYGHYVTNYRVLVEKLDIPYGTVRHVIRRLAGAGCLRTTHYKTAGIQGIEVWYRGLDNAVPQQIPAEMARPVDGSGDM